MFKVTFCADLGDWNRAAVVRLGGCLALQSPLPTMLQYPAPPSACL